MSTGKSFLDKALKVNWQTVVDVKSNVLTMDVNGLALKRNYIKKALDINYEYETFYYFDNTVAYSDKDLAAFFKLVQKKLQASPNYYFTFPNRAYLLADALLNHSRMLGKQNLVKTERRELIESLNHYIELYKTAFPLLLISIPIETIITGELEEFLRSTIDQGDVDSYEEHFQALTQRSSKTTFFQQDYRGLLLLGKTIQSNPTLSRVFKNSSKHAVGILGEKFPDFLKKLEEHNARFGWLNMYLFRRLPFTLQDQISRLKDVLEKDCLKEIKTLSTKEQLRQKSFDNTLISLNLPTRLKKKIEYLSEYVYLRTYRLDIFTLSTYYARNLFTEICNRLNLEYEELGLLTVDEITGLLSNRISLDSINLDDRKKGYAYVQLGHRAKVITDKNDLKILREAKYDKHDKDVREVKGDPASNGYAKGVARIVMHPTQVTKVQKGDVLIAPMTSPDFVMGMLKAVAIVTDHGGITSHAAIVSRELGVPCVVGTKIATKVFKDGDNLEVDATKGIVRKI